MPMFSETVSVPAGSVTLAGDCVVPAGGRAMLLCAHGVDRSRHSPTSRGVATEFNTAGFGTLMLDLLSEQEDSRDAMTDEQRSDIELLARRLVAGVDWLKIQPDTRALPVIVWGMGTEAAVAVEAAAELPDLVLGAVVWGGRPDLAGRALRRVRVPVLVVVGGQDPGRLRQKQDAAPPLAAPHVVRVVPGASDLFEEPDALAAAVTLTKEWCDDRLRSAGNSAEH